MAITVQKELYLSVFPHIAIVKIDNIWRICRGHYTYKAGGDADLFVIPYMGQIVRATYPDFRIYDLNGTEEQLYQVVCDYNVSQLSQKKAVVAAGAGRPVNTIQDRAGALTATERMADLLADEIRQQVTNEILQRQAERIREQTATEIQQRIVEEERRRMTQRERNDLYYTTVDDTYTWPGYITNR